MNGVRAFEGLASNYQRFRPNYPAAVLERLKSFVESGVAAEPGDLILVDVGSGTGISTRLLRAMFGPAPKIFGIETSNDMLRAAVLNTSTESSISYLHSRAERLPFNDATVTLILAAQSVQWFERPLFYSEVRRVLVSGGTFAILENNRRWQCSPFLDAYEGFLEAHSESYSRHYREHDYSSELISTSGFAVLPPNFVDWSRPMDLKTFLGMAMSSTKVQAVVRAEGEAVTRAQLEALAVPWLDPQGRLKIDYRCQLLLARRVI